MQYYFKTESLFDIAPEAFNPPPKVMSAIIRLVPHQTLPYIAKDEAQFAIIVREAFNHRRKTLRKCLSPFISPETLTALNIDPNLRPEQLSLHDFVTISNAVS